MRTTVFRDVFNWLVRLHGRDPLAEINQDMRKTLTGHINSRVRTIAMAWRWPEWELTEERAFRQVWNATHQYYIANPATGKPDEVFYIPTLLYYTVNATALANPPIGTLPTDTDFFTQLDSVGSYIAYDQACRRSIGIVRGVYRSNPLNGGGCCSGLFPYRPSERGIEVMGSHGATVFITYTMPVPSYTMQPWVAALTYFRGDVVYDPPTGECFQALTTSNDPVQSTVSWSRVPFLEVWQDYVTSGAYSDSLMEFDQGGNTEVQAKILLSQAADTKASDSLQLEVDALVAQGQKLQYNFCKPRGTCCETLPWTGGTVSTLTDECQDSFGWVYPVAPSVIPARLIYRPDIVAILTVDGVPSLEGLTTVTSSVGTLVTIVIQVGGVPESQNWRLDAGQADPTDPGQVQPEDWDLGTNNKHWRKVI